MKKYLVVIATIFILLFIEGSKNEVTRRIRESKKIELQQEKQKVFELSIKFAQDISSELEKMLKNKNYSKIDDKINFIDSIEVEEIINNTFIEKVNNSILNNNSKEEMLKHKDEIILNQKDVIKNRLYLEEAFTTLDKTYIDKAEKNMQNKIFYTEELKTFLNLCREDIQKIQNETFTEEDYNNLIKAEERYMQSLKRVAGVKKDIEAEAREVLQKGF